MITVCVANIRWKNRKLPVEVDRIEIDYDYKEKDFVDNPEKEREVIKLIDKYFEEKYAEIPKDYDWDLIKNKPNMTKINECKCDRCGKISKYKDMFITRDQDVSDRTLVVCEECSKNYLNPISIKKSMKQFIDIVNDYISSKFNIRRFRITNMNWDQDSDDDNELPAHFIIDVAFPDISDIVSDEISDKYQYCHNGFDLEEIPINDEEDV